MTVVFGLFHGVVFFPVLLSLCGPNNNTDEEDDKDDNENRNNTSNGNIENVPSNGTVEVKLSF